MEQFCPFDPNGSKCLEHRCGLWCEPFDARTDVMGEGRCAFVMIAQQLNDISNTEMGAEHL